MQNLCLITDVYRKNCCLHNSVFSPACRIDLICSFSTEEFSCSESGVGSAILPLLACKRDMTSHLVNLGISGKRGQGEAEVSESGAGE